jgi:hypothetical protein
MRTVFAMRSDHSGCQLEMTSAGLPFHGQQVTNFRQSRLSVGSEIVHTSAGNIQGMLCRKSLYFPCRASVFGRVNARVAAMLQKCANPSCANPFRRLSEGKLFLVETGSDHPSNGASRRWDGSMPHRIEHFWLCSQCASVLTLAFEKGTGLKTVPLPQPNRRKSAASIVLAAAAAKSA